MQSKVSIIVPCWGVEKYLNRCVESLVNQTLRDIQIILVDDQSPDRVPLMCDEWALKDDRITVIHKQNEGLGKARNSGLEIAVGEYVTFLDSDDYVELNAYEVMYREAKNNKLDICYFKHRRFTDSGNHIEIEKKSDKNVYIYDDHNKIEDLLLNVVGKNPLKRMNSTISMSVCMALFRKECLDEIGTRFVSERVVASEDLIFDIELIPNVKRIGVFPFVFYNYYINPKSITTTYNEPKYQRMMRLLDVVKVLLLKKYKWEKFKNHYYSQQLRIIKIILKYESKSNMGLGDKLTRIRRHCDEPIFCELYNDKVLRHYSLINYLLVKMMKHRMVLPLYLLYKYCR